MTSKKIVRIIARLNIGGPAIHTVLLSSELNKKGCRDVLVCGRVSESEGDMSYLAKEKGIEPIVIASLRREISPVRDLKALISLYSIISREKPDIVHTHTAKAGTLGRLAAIFAGVPVKIHTFHGHVFDGYFSPVKERIFLAIEKILAVFTDNVITVSDMVRDEIVNKLKVCDASKCVVVPLGFELERFLECEKRSGELRKELGIGNDLLLVGIVGRLVPIKNHKMFLDAAIQILDKNKNIKVKFVIIGDGECASALKDHAAMSGIRQDVMFTGWKKDLEAVYADLDVVALTSLNEGTPVSLIEAMACSKPVVATNVGGVKDVVIDGESGFLCASNDAEGFAEKVSELLHDRAKREKFGAFGRASVMNKYAKERLVGDIESLYEECLTKKRSGRGGN